MSVSAGHGSVSNTTTANVNRVQVDGNCDFLADNAPTGILELFSMSDPVSVSVDDMSVSSVIDKHRVYAGKESALHYVDIDITDGCVTSVTKYCSSYSDSSGPLGSWPWLT